MVYVVILSIVILVLTISLFVLLRTSLLLVTVQGESMAPALHQGNRVLVLRSWLAGRPHKGQVVVISPPGEPFMKGTAHLYMKRVVAVAGDAFSAPLHINTNALKEDEALQESSQVKCWHIPPRHVFVCGDNRQYSIDSRSWGPLPLDNIHGIVLRKLKGDAPLSSQSSLAPQNAWLPIGQPAPPFSAQTVEGYSLSLQDFVGQRLLLLCTPYHRLAREMIPSFLALALRLEHQGVACVFVTSDPLDRARLMVEEQNIHLPVLVTPQGHHPFYQDYGLEFTPAFYLIDERGRIEASGHPDAGSATWKAVLQFSPTGREEGNPQQSEAGTSREPVSSTGDGS
jgi:signal peptidase I